MDIQAGIDQAIKYQVDVCPQCGGQAALWANDGTLYNWDIECTKCGFTLHGNNLRATVRKWNYEITRQKGEHNARA